MQVENVASSDERFMAAAIALARKGDGFVDPNPLVGAVIVRDGTIVAQGYHEEYGHLHAERNALADAAAKGIDVRGLTMYVTLEPCSHYGKTPPCALAVVECGITRVVVGSLDPNPKVDGKGIRILRDAGIDVEILSGPLAAQCKELNETFFHFIETGLPFVIHKYAMSLDGKIAGANGEQLTISGAASHERVHEDRARYASIVTGVGTVLADDPRLTARPTRPAGKHGIHQPLRVVVDSRLRTPLDSAVVAESARDGLTLIVTTSTDETRVQEYRAAGCEVVVLAHEEGSAHVSVAALMAELGRRGVDSVYLEAGGRLAASFLAAGCIDKVEAFIAPVIVGADSAPSPVMGETGTLRRLHSTHVTRCGDDVLFEGLFEELSQTKDFSEDPKRSK
jgi:diaminohydroxyphosphoribosylaminopyrimidine deaminase/5-amino-6-(5-phosphoribosylamino)uracil reductase